MDGDRAAGDLEVAKPISTTHHAGAIANITRPRGRCQCGRPEAPVPVYRPQQRSFLDLEREELLEAEKGSVPWLLVRYRDAIFPEWLTSGWLRGQGRRGRKAWPVETLLALLVLRWSEQGTSRVGACRRARGDALWRYAMGLPMGGRTPTEKTLREVEAWLLAEHEGSGLSRKQMLFEHVVHVALWSASARGRGAPRWFMDSTPMWCFGAVLDTVRLLGDGLRQLGRAWARTMRRSLASVARTWDAPLLIARSTKGWLRIDWHDPEARSTAISRLVELVLRVVEDVTSRLAKIEDTWAGAQAGRLCKLLLRVVEQDLVKDDKGRWTIAKQVARNRLVSLTDPEAGHGHKTRSESFWGYKTNVLGDLDSGVIAALSVTPGNGHDAAPGHELVARVQRMRIEIDRILADTAYGGIESRLHLRSLGVDLVAPAPASSHPSDKLSKNDFTVDFEAGVAICPNGARSIAMETTRGKEPKIAFRWHGTACGACPLRQQCLRARSPKSSKNGKSMGRPPKGGKRLVLGPFERELREARAEWEDPTRREEYRDRSMGERLNAALVQHGARSARSRGRPAADLQAHLIGMTVNLGILARNLAATEAAARGAGPTRRRAAGASRPRAAAAAADRRRPAGRPDRAPQLPLLPSPARS